MRYLLSRVDRRVYMDYSVCALIRKHTAEALTKFVTEFACKSPSNGDVKASTKSEKLGYGHNSSVFFEITVAPN